MTQKNIKFSKQDTDFISELREKVKNYFETEKKSKYGNTNLYIKSLFMLALYLIPYILMLNGIVYSVSLVLLCWICMGFGLAGIGMVHMHDANHGSFSENTKVNQWMSKSLYILGGYPPNWKQQHNAMHHGYTNIDGYDEDIDPASILRFSPHKPLLKIHKYQYRYAWALYCLMTLSWVTAKDFSRLKKYKKMGVSLRNKKGYKHLFTELIIAKILYYLFILVIPILVVPVSWYWIVIGFLLMHFVGGFILSAIFQSAHVVPTTEYPLPDENGMIENNWAIHQLQTTSNYSPGNRILSWLIGGLNYQVEHHLFPNICHVHYKNLSPIVKSTAQKYHLPYNQYKYFFEAIEGHTKMLKKLGRQ